MRGAEPFGRVRYAIRIEGIGAAERMVHFFAMDLPHSGGRRLQGRPVGRGRPVSPSDPSVSQTASIGPDLAPRAGVAITQTNGAA